MNINESIDQANEFAGDQTTGIMEDAVLLNSKYGEIATKNALLLIAANMLSALLADAESKKEKDMLINAIVKIAEEKAKEINIGISH